LEGRIQRAEGRKRRDEMLVLTRDREQSIIISSESGPIEVKIVSIEGGHVRVGIIAPSNLVVDRKEIWEAKETAKRRWGRDRVTG
jgi:carbon storage regulator CsrA